MKKPIIAISSNEKDDYDGWFNTDKIYYCKSAAADVVRMAGGLPVVIPVMDNEKDLEQYFDFVDGLVITGGHDVHPALYEENMHTSCGDLHPITDFYDSVLVKTAMKKKLPTLVMCRGVQITNVAFGGTLYQDVNVDLQTNIKHHAPKEGDLLVHNINVIAKDSLFTKITGINENIFVNSIHHQGINAIAPIFKEVAKADDGVVEVIELKKPTHFFIGTQFHPEILGSRGDKVMLSLYQALVEAAKETGNYKG